MSRSAPDLFLASLSSADNPELEYVLDVLLSFLRESVSFDSANIMLLSEEGDLRVEALVGYETKMRQKLKGLRLRAAESPILQTCLNESVLIEDTLLNEDWFIIPGLENIRSWLGIPLRVAGKSLGIFSIDKREAGFFTPEHVRLAEMFAPVAAIAINIADFDNNLKAHLVGLTSDSIRQPIELPDVILSELKAFLDQVQQLDDVLNKLVHETVRVLATDDASIILADLDQATFVTSATTVVGQPPSTPAIRARSKGGATRWIIDNMQPMLVSDIRKDPFGSNDMLEEYGYQAYIGVPLIIFDNCIGVLYGLSREVRHFTESDTYLMNTLANHAVTAVHSALLLKEIQDYVAGLENRMAGFGLGPGAGLPTLVQGDTPPRASRLRSPLSNLNRYVLMLEQSNSNEQEKYLEIFKDSVRQLNKLIDSVMVLSRLDYDPSRFSFGRISWYPIIQDALDKFRPAAAAKNLELVFIGERDLAQVWGDAKHLGEAVGFLLSNAIAYTAEGRIELNIEFSPRKNWLGLVVRDSGVGIPTGELSHIFEPFYRGSHIDQHEIPGMGVGLTILKKIMDRHNGRVTVETSNEGTTFTLWLPVSKKSPGE